MVVMFLIAAAASLVLPVTVRAYASFKLRLAAASIGKLFQQAKSRALFEGHTYLVIFPPSAGQTRNLILTRDDGRSENQVALPAGVILTGRRDQGEWTQEIEVLPFYPDGTCEALQLNLQNSSRSPLRLEVDPMTARTRMLPPNEEQP
jgi:Tfp pilus assembly protein FimT